MPRFNYENRNRILGLLEAGISQSEVARLVQRVRHTGTVADRPRLSQRRVISRRQYNYIRQRRLRDRF